MPKLLDVIGLGARSMGADTSCCKKNDEVLEVKDIVHQNCDYEAAWLAFFVWCEMVGL